MFRIWLLDESVSVIVVLGDFFRDELSVNQIFVNTSHLKEFLVSATLLNFTVLHDDNLVCVTNRAQSVSDHDDSLLA